MNKLLGLTGIFLILAALFAVPELSAEAVDIDSGDEGITTLQSENGSGSGVEIEFMQDAEDEDGSGSGSVAGPAPECKTRPLLKTSCLARMVVNTLGYAFLLIGMLMGGIVDLFLFQMLSIIEYLISLNPTDQNSPFFDIAVQAYAVTVSIANLLILFGFFYVGYRYLFGIQDKKVGWQEFLIKVVAATILVNFSIFLVSIFVSILHGIGELFINIFSQGGGSIGGAFQNAIKKAGGYDSTPWQQTFPDLFAKISDVWGEVMIKLLYPVIGVLIIMELFKMVRIVVTRFVMLFLLLVISPIGVVCYFSPVDVFQKAGRDWLKQIWVQASMYPIFVIALAIGGFFVVGFTDAAQDSGYAGGNDHLMRVTALFVAFGLIKVLVNFFEEQFKGMAEGLWNQMATAATATVGAATTAGFAGFNAVKSGFGGISRGKKLGEIAAGRHTSNKFLRAGGGLLGAATGAAVGATSGMLKHENAVWGMRAALTAGSAIDTLGADTVNRMKQNKYLSSLAQEVVTEGKENFSWALRKAGSGADNHINGAIFGRDAEGKPLGNAGLDISGIAADLADDHLGGIYSGQRGEHMGPTGFKGARKSMQRAKREGERVFNQQMGRNRRFSSTTATNTIEQLAESGKSFDQLTDRERQAAEQALEQFGENPALIDRLGETGQKWIRNNQSAFDAQGLKISDEIEKSHPHLLQSEEARAQRADTLGRSADIRRSTAGLNRAAFDDEKFMKSFVAGAREVGHTDEDIAQVTGKDLSSFSQPLHQKIHGEDGEKKNAGTPVEYGRGDELPAEKEKEVEEKMANYRGFTGMNRRTQDAVMGHIRKAEKEHLDGGGNVTQLDGAWYNNQFDEAVKKLGSDESGDGQFSNTQEIDKIVKSDMNPQQKAEKVRDQLKRTNDGAKFIESVGGEINESNYQAVASAYNDSVSRAKETLMDNRNDTKDVMVEKARSSSNRVKTEIEMANLKAAQGQASGSGQSQPVVQPTSQAQPVTQVVQPTTQPVQPSTTATTASSAAPTGPAGGPSPSVPPGGSGPGTPPVSPAGLNPTTGGPAPAPMNPAPSTSGDTTPVPSGSYTPPAPDQLGGGGQSPAPTGPAGGSSGGSDAGNLPVVPSGPTPAPGGPAPTSAPEPSSSASSQPPTPAGSARVEEETSYREPPSSPQETSSPQGSTTTATTTSAPAAPTTATSVTPNVQTAPAAPAVSPAPVVVPVPAPVSVPPAAPSTPAQQPTQPDYTPTPEGSNEAARLKQEYSGGRGKEVTDIMNKVDAAKNVLREKTSNQGDYDSIFAQYDNYANNLEIANPEVRENISDQDTRYLQQLAQKAINEADDFRREKGSNVVEAKNAIVNILNNLSSSTNDLPIWLNKMKDAVEKADYDALVERLKILINKTKQMIDTYNSSRISLDNAANILNNGSVNDSLNSLHTSINKYTNAYDAYNQKRRASKRVSVRTEDFNDLIQAALSITHSIESLNESVKKIN